jgi:hypothetical protein
VLCVAPSVGDLLKASKTSTSERLLRGVAGDRDCDRRNVRGESVLREDLRCLEGLSARRGLSGDGDFFFSMFMIIAAFR